MTDGKARLFVAFAAAALAPGLAVGVFLDVVLNILFGASFHTPFAATPEGGLMLLLGPFMGMLYGCVYSVPLLLILGLPAHLALRRLHLATGWAYMLAGALIALVGASIVPGFLVFASPLASPHGLVSALPGALSGGLFWLIARPDRLIYTSQP
ncbi:hypothetical protein [Acidocella sp.]|uniref:hypothetical protein n=1 Tax=Acidocella sp. TaxID=50710 RepID=UPI00260DEF02|nr:hypothetical protein [Acidocella sp.]